MNMEKRYQKAIREIGGPQGLSKLPDEVKDVLKSATQLDVKVQLLEAIAVAVRGVNHMTRTEMDVRECWSESTREFDWDRYQYLCDIAEYWDLERDRQEEYEQDAEYWDTEG